MNYSNIFSDLRKNSNRNGKFSTCWLAAITENFYGTGPRKLSKSDIEKEDIASICDEILDGITTNKTNNLQLPTQLTLGALKILEKQVDFLKEKCEDVYNRSIIPEQINKLSKRKESVNELYNKEIEDIDVKSLFHTPKKKHLLSEKDYQLPINASWEWTFYNADEMSLVPSEIISIPTVLEGPARDPEQLCDLDETMTPKGTPKRKSRKSHSDTPSKRSRKDKDSAPSSSKITEVTAHSTSEQPSSSKARTSASPQLEARRSLFPPQYPHQEPSAVDANDKQERPPIAEPSQQIPRVVVSVEEPMDQSVPQDPEVHPQQQANVVPPSMVSQEISIDNAVTDNVQDIAPAVIQENREDELAMPLPELTDDSLLERSRRPRTRKFVIFDEEKKIDIENILLDPNLPNIHTRKSEKKVDLYLSKVPATTLLSLPSVQLKLEIRRDKIRCSWGKTLAGMFLERIEAPRIDVTRENGENGLRRDAFVNKDRRRTTFISERKSAISSTSESAKSIQESVHDVYANADDEFQDPMLLPPLQPPLEDNQLPSTPGREHQAQNLSENEQQPIAQQGVNGLQSSSIVQSGERQHQPSPIPHLGERGLQVSPIVQRERLQHPSPHTPRPGPRPIDSTHAASPQQRGRPSGADLPQHEPFHASDSPIASHLVMDHVNIEGARHSSPRLSEHSSRAGSESMIIEYRKYFMTKEEFCDFLEKIWTILRNRRYSEVLKFDLKVILVPNESACEEIIVYFNYLCVCEKEKKLHIKQDQSYSTVAIVKSNSN